MTGILNIVWGVALFLLGAVGFSLALSFFTIEFLLANYLFSYFCVLGVASATISAMLIYILAIFNASIIFRVILFLKSH